MPLVYQQNINDTTKMGVWHIEEEENYFLRTVSLQRDIKNHHKRLQHLAGRLLLKELFPGFPNELIKIADTRKPFLEDEAYHFSISHCGDFAAAIVSKHNRVGVDIEMLNAKAEKVKHKFLGVDEQQLIHSFQHPHSFTAGWSIKETLYKWNGENEIDFIEHLHILNIESEQKKIFTASCNIKKIFSVDLKVTVKFFDDFVLAWCAQ